MPIGKSIRVYLADATVSGIRYAELVNWTGQAIACPRNRLSELKSWPEASKPGVYILFEGRFGGSKPLAYIGESEDVADRLTSHARNKDFWSEVVIFTSKDENLTKAHIKFLESTLANMARDADRYELENGNNPKESSLPRADRASMEEFVDNLRMVLGTLGYSVLEPILRANNTDQLAATSDFQDEYLSLLRDLHFSVNGISARGAVTDEGFVLKKGSQLVMSNGDSMPGKLLNIKEKLLDDGVLAKAGGHLVASEDILFNSSSYAAAIVAGTSRSGPQGWKTPEGVTMKKIEDEQLAES